MKSPFHVLLCQQLNRQASDGPNSDLDSFSGDGPGAARAPSEPSSRLAAGAETRSEFLRGANFIRRLESILFEFPRMLPESCLNEYRA
ncbi:hypothetical protein VTN96DRAFT_1409 [Rasamsonia emersonii]